MALLLAGGKRHHAGGSHANPTFAGDTNHNGSTDNKSITIAKAASTTTVTVAGGASFTYDGNTHPATVSVTGIGNLSLAPAPVYSCGHAPVEPTVAHTPKQRRLRSASPTGHQLAVMWCM